MDIKEYINLLLKVSRSVYAIADELAQCGTELTKEQVWEGISSLCQYRDQAIEDMVAFEQKFEVDHEVE